jgi:hypothetical protein
MGVAARAAVLESRSAIVNEIERMFVSPRPSRLLYSANTVGARRAQPILMKRSRRG